MSGAHVLVVDDEPRYRDVIRFTLEEEGYRVTCAATGEEALAAFRRQDPDLVVLDLMLPGLDGFEVCRRIRDLSTRPILILTARGADEDKVKGLRLGADDYVTKPFSADELLARVDAVLRRSQFGETPARRAAFVAGNLSIDYLARRVTLRGEDVRLSPTEYRLLSCLAASPGVVLERDELLEKVWGKAYRGEYELLRVALWRLRHKLEDDSSQPRFIVNRPGVGYMFAVDADAGNPRPEV